ncbi:MAG: type II secretion system protein GspL [Gallionella sp.]|nr:type II secretion system protein GspL [Gallionella sp.]
MSTLYIRLPSRSSADSAARWLELACPFALVSGGDSIEREGVASLPDLSGAAATAQRVVLLLAASDVTLLRVQIPPLPAAKLKAALPNLVEDQLLVDPSGCAVVAGDLSGGLRTVAVMQRDWLDFLVSTLIASGARRIAALPAQLCLPCQPGQSGSVTAAISEQGNGIDLMLRFTEQEGIGLVIGHEQHEAPAQEVIRTLCALVPEAPVTLYVPQTAVRAYQEAISHADALNKRINVLAGNWPHWIAGVHGAVLDMMAGSRMAASHGLDWRAWRWPIGLAAAVLLTNAIALNADWWRMKNEANSLRAAMIQTYKSAYPKETVILDPAAQMRQKIDAAKRNAGLPAPDDFTAILAAFGETWGEAWESVMPGKMAPVIEVLEYRERSLIVRFKPAPSRVEGPDMEAPLQRIKAALAERDLLLDPVSAQPAAVWKIRSAK